MKTIINTQTSLTGLHVIEVVEQSHKLIFPFKNTCLALISSEEELFSGVF
jgi:hypothetical protein